MTNSLRMASRSSLLNRLRAPPIRPPLAKRARTPDYEGYPGPESLRRVALTVLRIAPGRRRISGSHRGPCAVGAGKEKGGPPKGPALRAVSGWLPNDPAGQQTTGHEQGGGAERDDRGTTRGRQLGRSGRGSRSSCRGSCRGSSRSGVGSSSRSGAATGAYVNGAVLKRNGLPEAREHLLLVNTQALGSPSNRAGAFT